MTCAHVVCVCLCVSVTERVCVREATARGGGSTRAGSVQNSIVILRVQPMWRVAIGAACGFRLGLKFRSREGQPLIGSPTKAQKTESR